MRDRRLLPYQYIHCSEGKKSKIMQLRIKHFFACVFTPVYLSPLLLFSSSSIWSCQLHKIYYRRSGASQASLISTLFRALLHYKTKPSIHHVMHMTVWYLFHRECRGLQVCKLFLFLFLFIQIFWTPLNNLYREKFVGS